MLDFENYVSFAKDEEPVLQLRNFWEPEDGFVWSKGKWCEVTFEFDGVAKPAKGLAELMLDVDVFKAPEVLTGQNLLIYLNGYRIGSSFVAQRMNSISTFDAGILRPTENVLTIDTPDSNSPGAFGRDDLRVLGMQLFSIQIRPMLQG
jgi:hypothetical protein